MTSNQPQLKPVQILHCHCVYSQAVPAEVKTQFLSALAASGRPFVAVPDLCDMSARKDPALGHLASSGPIKISACYERAVRWLFHAAGAALPQEGVELLNMRAETAESILDRLTAPMPSTSAEPKLQADHSTTIPATGNSPRIVLYEGEGSELLEPSERIDWLTQLLENGFEVSCASHHQPLPAESGAWLAIGKLNGNPPSLPMTGSSSAPFLDIANKPMEEILQAARDVRKKSGARVVGAWKPWFPVIDYDRCTNCMQCLSFCLFDVYGVDADHKITLRNQSNCKTDCPACSRVCPEAAIIFPKYKHAPINGDRVREDGSQREAMKVDISSLLGGDVYSSLRTRFKESRKRFSTERDESRALLERKRCLSELKEQFDIPDEILMTLPSVGEIQERAERAKAKLQKRKEQSQTLRDERGQTDNQEEWGI